MRLFLIRHGDAVSERVNIKRPLSTKGRDEIFEVAVRLKSLGHSIDTIFHSRKDRAKETAQILKHHLNTNCQLFAKNLIAHRKQR